MTLTTIKPYDLIPSSLKDLKIDYKVTRAVKYGKTPIKDENWSTEPEKYSYRVSDLKVIEHINNNNNLLLLCGTFEKASNIYDEQELKDYQIHPDDILYLIGCDFDNKEYYDKKKVFLNPKTLTWQSPSGNTHVLYWTNYYTKGVRVKKKNIDGSMGETLIDIQGDGKLLGLPPNEVIDEKYGDSLPHKYVPLNDIKPAFMRLEDMDTLFCNDENTNLIGELIEKVSLPKEEYKVTTIRHQIRQQVPIEDYLKKNGIMRKGSSKNYKCPLHPMKGNGNLSVNFPDRVTKLPTGKAFCHDCQVIGDVVDWRAKIEKISFKQAELLFIKELGLVLPDTKVEIELPRTGRLISDFCKDVGEVCKDKNKLFFKTDIKMIVEVTNNIIDNKNKNESFSQIKPSRYITLLEEDVIPYVYVESPEVKNKNKKSEEKVKMEYIIKPKSVSSELAKTMLESEILQSSFPPIQRIFNSPIPTIHNNILTFPQKGYDERFKSWLTEEAPEIDIHMPLEQAQNIIRDMLEEFSFRSKQDFSNAVAAILTPQIKGILPRFTTRVPMFAYMANRPGVGKGYLAAIPNLINEGNHINEPPISTSDKGNDGSDELRKKITSAIIAGRASYCSDNNKGHMDSPVLEAALTSEKLGDRLLGSNTNLTLDNELVYSFTGNVNLTLSSDLQRRIKIIYLETAVEDINSRKFKKTNLHQWILQNRGLILSALYALIRNWFEKGCPKSKIEYNSFPEWGATCGGIMETAGYLSPCNQDEGLIISTDPETDDMKSLFETVYEHFPEQWITKRELQDLVAVSDCFTYMDFSKKSDQIAFGKKISKFIGRVLSGTLLVIKDLKQRSTRQELMFTKNIQTKLNGHIFELEVPKS